MARFTQITPFLPVGELERALTFYQDYLGFEAGFVSDGYAFIHREGTALRLIETGAGKDLSDPNSQTMIYVDVEDVDGLYETLRAKLETLPQGRVRAPFNQDYGQREFHVIDEDVTLLLFGERIKP